MFAIGHFGLGYLLGKGSAKLLDVKLDLALLFTVSVLPDFDLLFSSFVRHRGATHSLLFSLLLCLPFFVVYRKKTVPYFVALLSHSLIGDVFSGGVQLFWPFSKSTFFISQLAIIDNASAIMELAFFVACTVVMFVNKDFQRMLFSKINRLYWLVPLGSVLVPLLLNHRSYTNLPPLLVAPSIFCVAVFSYAIIGPKHVFKVIKNNE